MKTLLTIEQKVAFGIYCASEVYKETGFSEWAEGWLSDRDRSVRAASVVREAATKSAIAAVGAAKLAAVAAAKSAAAAVVAKWAVEPETAAEWAAAEAAALMAKSAAAKSLAAVEKMIVNCVEKARLVK